MLSCSVIIPGDYSFSDDHCKVLIDTNQPKMCSGERLYLCRLVGSSKF